MFIRYSNNDEYHKQIRKHFSDRYYLHKDHARRDGIPFDYEIVLKDLNEKKIWQKHMNYAPWSPKIPVTKSENLTEPTDYQFDSFRIHMQFFYQFRGRWGGGFLARPYNIFVNEPFRIKYHKTKEILTCYVSGKELCTVSSEAPVQSFIDFEIKVRDYLFEKIENFVRLSEQEKTVYLLKRLGIKVLFTKRGRSWIVNSNLWVVSETARFSQVNRIILENLALAHFDVYHDVFRFNLNALLFFILGSSYLEFADKVDEKNNTYYFGNSIIKGEKITEIEKVNSDLCFFIGFADPKTLLRRFIKSNIAKYNKTHEELVLQLHFPWAYWASWHIKFYVKYFHSYWDGKKYVAKARKSCYGTIGISLNKRGHNHDAVKGYVQLIEYGGANV